MPSKKKLDAIKISKSDVIKKVSENTRINKNIVKVIFEEIFKEVISELSSGNSVTVHGFGSFEPKFVRNKICKNPKTQEEVSVPDKIVPHFAAGKILASSLQDNQNELLALFGYDRDTK